ncbi:DnaB-like helicase C-terminal domain-containing protein [Salinicoccus roseus]|uniref:DnaB-like helicase C-terminal domain-containing protein n=1 Tax=Salinicoccus roseus TaxID=45670 RepID=A0ABT4YKN7_9STAP|nr:DnaB-like helicase C-terminal domain-containing protein [Salinicoccus roseus]MDB0581340.1 DnaB-like helicase C-terminal domain-containing protein [Salinicoccus roseus]
MNDLSRFTEVEYFEKTVLAKALHFPHLRRQLRLEPEYFENDKHGAVAARLLNDPAFDKQQLISESVKSPEVYGDYGFVKQIAYMDVPTDKGFMFDQEQVAEHYKHRELQRAIEQYTNAPGPAGRMNIRSRIDKLEKIDLVQEDSKHDTLNTIFHSLYSEASTTITKTGVASLDRIISGVSPKQLILVGARPSMGKTALALQMAQNMQSEQNEIIFFSAETTEVSVTQRILATLTGVNLTKFKEPSRMMTSEEIDKVIDGIKSYHFSNIKIKDDATVTPNKVRAAANTMPEGKRGVIFIDYIQLMQSDVRQRDRRTELEEISRELKIIAKDMDVTIIALSQLSRANDARQDKRPVLSDLRETGQLEQDADMVFFCHREDYYVRNGASPSEDSRMEIIVAKNKDGPTGTAHATFQRHNQRIYGSCR